MKIGIDIGGSHIGTGIVMNGGVLLGKESINTNISKLDSKERVENILLETIDMEINTLLKRYDFRVSDISKIGIGVPGSPTETAMCNLVNLHIDRFEIGKILADKYNTTVKLKNDGKCAGFAEHLYGAIKGYDDAVFLCLGTGIGSAVFMNGKLLEPHKNPGFEFGHMMIDRNGRQCNCGNKGCWERYASMKHFKADAIEQLKLPKDMLPEEVQAYIRKNKETEEVSKFLDTYLDYVAIGVTNIINILEPQVVCFGGSFSYYEDVFLPILDKKVKELAFNKNSETKLVTAKLKTDAGMIGAAEI